MVVDNFQLEQFNCPAKYYLRIVRGLTPVSARPALSFGQIVHLGLAEWYRSGSVEAAHKAISENWPGSWPDDFRTEDYAHRVIDEYVQRYPVESWEVVKGPNGPMVEVAFTLPTGMYLECQSCLRYAGEDDIRSGTCSSCQQALEPIVYGGIIDLLIRFSESLFVLDHKTTTRLGDGTYYFMQYKPDSQITGYIWAASKLSSAKVGGAIINAIGLYKSRSPEFRRSVTGRSQFEIDEWLQGVVDKCNAIKRCERTGIWRLETSHCMDYGECSYRPIHVLSDQHSREKRIETDYVYSPWNYEARDE